MKNAFIKTAFFILTITILTASLNANAALVPCLEEPCTPCDLWVLAYNIVWFLLFSMALPILTVALLAGGVMILISGGNQSLREKGKALIWNGLVGILIAFSAYLIINTIIATLANGKFTAGWATIEGCGSTGGGSGGDGDDDITHEESCNTNADCSSGKKCTGPGGTCVSTSICIGGCPTGQICSSNGTCVPTTTGGTLTDAEARAQLANACGGSLSSSCINIQSSGGCSDPTNRSCTSLQGMKQSTINQIIATQQGCSCPIIITGGTETGHSIGHSDGSKFDISRSTAFENWLSTNSGFTKIGTPTFGLEQYRAPNGSIYTRETGPPHWDVSVP